MNPKDEDFICFYRDAVLAGHDDPAAETMRCFNLSRDYTVRLLNEAIARCDGQQLETTNEVARAPLTNALNGLPAAFYSSSLTVRFVSMPHTAHT
jgi:hypothetical protein